MFKLVLKNVTAALSDPWVQGIFGLMLLARATDGMTRQLSQVQDMIQQTQAMAAAAPRLFHVDSPQGQPETNGKPQVAETAHNASE